MKVLVTGGAGYIGSVLIRRLLKEGHHVRVLDNLMFGGESLMGIYNEPGFEFIKGDVRDKVIVRAALRDIEGVVHLAALVGHPLCNVLQKETYQINYEATCVLLEEAIFQNVKRFVFASTCSSYGISDNDKPANEDSPLMPLSLYAESKVKAEQHILSFSKKKTVNLCILRLATIFGLSARMRFDLLINQLARDALLKKKIVIKNLYVWRPFLHTQDAADIFMICLKAPAKLISGEVFNVGRGNYQKIEILKIIKRYIPEVKAEVLEDSNDKRDYKVSFKKIKKILGFKAKFDLSAGIKEVKDAIVKGIISDPQELKYTNLGFKK